MWYQFTNTDSDGQPVNRDGRFTVPGFDGFVEVTSTGKANLPEDVGAALVESGFPIEPTDGAGGQDGSQDASDDDGEGEDTDDHEQIAQ